MNSSNRVWMIDEQQRYQIEKRLDGGGMGDIYLATDTRLGKQVALKLLKDYLASDHEMRMRFEREMVISAALKSQHIVQVSDYGLTVDGHLFYVMEYLQGQTLAALLHNKGRLDVLQVYQILSQVCAGLQVAHDGVLIWNEQNQDHELTKIVHRDLKPANIFLVPTTLGDLVKIIDFGIAKIRAFQAEHTSLTNTFLGTFHYAAPEQLETSQALDQRADIYSLGMIMYEMLTGNDPFGLDSRRNQVGSALWEVAHASKPPLPLRSQPMCNHLPPALEAIVNRCLEKSPDARFSSVGELIQALHSVVMPCTPTHLPSVAPVNVQSIPAKRPAHNNHPAEHVAPQEASHGDNRAPASRFPKFIPNITDPSSFSANRHASNPSFFRWVLATGGLLATTTIMTTIILKGPPQGSTPVDNHDSVASEVHFDQAFTPSLTQHVHDDTLTGHSEMVSAVALSVDEGTAYSSSADQTLTAWNLETGEPIQTFTGHVGSVTSVSLSPDERSLISSGSDATLRLWDAITGKLIRTFRGHEHTVWDAAISPDGKTLASASSDHTVRLWNLETGDLIRTLKGHNEWVFSVAFSSNGRTLASAGRDGVIHLWNAMTGELLKTLEGHEDAVRAIAFHPINDQLVSASWDHTLKLWDMNTGAVLRTFIGHKDRVVTVEFTRTGDHFVSGGLDHAMLTWSTHSSEPLKALSGHLDGVLSVAVGASGGTLVSGSQDTTLRVWRP